METYTSFSCPPPPLLLPLAHVFLFLFLFSSARSLDMYTCLFRRPSPLSITSPRAAFAVQSFFPSFYLSSQRYSFFCLSLRDGGAEAFFGLAFAGIKNIRGSFHPSNPSIHFSASDCVCIRVCARGEGGVRVRGSFSFLSPPATGACVRVCVLCAV